jgi:hypothetical protein
MVPAASGTRAPGRIRPSPAIRHDPKRRRRDIRAGLNKIKLRPQYQQVPAPGMGLQFVLDEVLRDG